ncbi:hypothetical protein C8J56DRAFT_905178 [Mycena floridula]|nr:hypothetical protein C8J56DRAFT_905178 [Mycena floridula]
MTSIEISSSLWNILENLLDVVTSQTMLDCSSVSTAMDIVAEFQDQQASSPTNNFDSPKFLEGAFEAYMEKLATTILADSTKDYDNQCLMFANIILRMERIFKFHDMRGNNEISTTNRETKNEQPPTSYMMQSLPLETIGEIGENCDISTTKTLSLTSRGIRRCVIPHLFRSVALLYGGEPISSYISLTENKELTNVIKMISVFGRCIDGEMVDLLDRLTSLVGIHISRCKFLPSSPTFKGHNIKIAAVDIASPTSVACRWIITCCPNLLNLDINCGGFYVKNCEDQLQACRGLKTSTLHTLALRGFGLFNSSLSAILISSANLSTVQRFTIEEREVSDYRTMWLCLKSVKCVEVFGYAQLASMILGLMTLSTLSQLENLTMVLSLESIDITIESATLFMMFDLHITANATNLKLLKLNVDMIGGATIDDEELEDIADQIISAMPIATQRDVLLIDTTL